MDGLQQLCNSLLPQMPQIVTPIIFDTISFFLVDNYLSLNGLEFIV
jgi:hypothetical protein